MMTSINFRGERDISKKTPERAALKLIMEKLNERFNSADDEKNNEFEWASWGEHGEGTLTFSYKQLKRMRNSQQRPETP